jgi:hypothetical protein
MPPGAHAGDEHLRVLGEAEAAYLGADVDPGRLIGAGGLSENGPSDDVDPVQRVDPRVPQRAFAEGCAAGPEHRRHTTAPIRHGTISSVPKPSVSDLLGVPEAMSTRASNKRIP